MAYMMPALFFLLDLLEEDLLPMTCPASLTTVAELTLAATILVKQQQHANGLQVVGCAPGTCLHR